MLIIQVSYHVKKRQLPVYFLLFPSTWYQLKAHPGFCSDCDRLELRETPAISADGKYFCYQVGNRPVGSQTLIIQATDSDWKMEFPGANAYNCFYTR